MQRLTTQFVAQLSAVLLLVGICAAADSVEAENASSIQAGTASAEDTGQTAKRSNARRAYLHPDYNVAAAPLPAPVSSCDQIDFDNDDAIGFADLMHLLERWGEPKAAGGEFGFAELLNVLTLWGSCA
jgi:hypothetical protein